MKNLTILAATLAVFTIGLASAGAKDSNRDSVVKIFTTRRNPDFLRPWTKGAASEVSGSGVVIAGQRILTNAHVVTYAQRILVQGNESTEKIHAQVVGFAPDMDLAVLKLDDESFFHGRPPLPLADSLPNIKDRVSVYGYPIGGEQLSVTEGIVSRIEFADFYYSANGLRIQVDAAINAGNSGGPAVSNGKIVGLVFSKISQAENIGYLIAAEEIATFLQDIASGKYHGKPTLYIQYQTTENEALRARLKMDRDTGGVMITARYRDDPHDPLQPWDVITQVGPHALDREGHVRVKDELRLAFEYFLPKLVHEGKVPMTILRDGKKLSVAVPVEADPHLLVPYLRGKYPPYFIYGPLVFSIATQELINQIDAKGIRYLTTRKNPLPGSVCEPKKSDEEETVILGYAFLPHKITQGYGNPFFAAVSRINGVPVKNLAQVVKFFRDGPGEYVTIEPAGKQEIFVFRRDELEKSTEDILADEGIRNQCSEELRDLWKGGKNEPRGSRSHP
jgi:S1-C subfamily serine protease